MEVSLQIPRLTRFLRAFTDLEADRSLIPVDHSKGRSIHLNVRSSQWVDFCESVRKELGPKSEAVKHLQALRNLAKEFTSDDQSGEVVEETSLYLLRLFSETSVVSNRQLTVLKHIFGNVSYALTEKICSVVNKILADLPEKLITQLKSNGGSKEGRKSKSPSKSWIAQLKFTPPSLWTPPDTSMLRDLVTEKKAASSFSMVYKKAKPTPLKFHRDWLLKTLETNFEKGDTLQEGMCETLLGLLTSSSSNDELQNELFDLLGFNQFELIQSLLENRRQIVQANTEKPKGKVDPPRRVNGSSQESGSGNQARKERHREACVDDLSVPDAKSGTSGGLKERKPLRDKYPHVYDSVLSAKLQAGFINGMKMMLPENVERVDNKQCEEVTIPACEAGALPRNIPQNLIPVSQLDFVGQQVFSGIQALNRIQSIVFETAYNTNENLLICAPTGAGKTNIALLTMVNTIRHHIVDDIIKRDTFKIVYVAPMKALAAEMTANFSKRLAPLGLHVRELTGDMQLTKTEILQTQVLVTTPEKWDVVTRKGTGDVALTKLVKLLIFDEVHLLHGDRGPVVEALVARTLRQVESSQSMIRIVGLSATLPNYLDVARFLRVNPHIGLYYFDGRFRPVPLKQTFIGVKAAKALQQMADMDSVCYDKVYDMVQQGHQVMVFVHARNATVRTANVLVELAQSKGQLSAFQPENSTGFSFALQAMSKARSKQLSDLFCKGFAVHHAGLLRSDRSLVEKYFGNGFIKVLVCTSTLAWGVNLPAHAVIIRGTEIYDAKHGAFIDLGILDVLQIFGRAGRPQFDTSGYGVIITSHAKLSHYLSLLTNQLPIESNFITHLADNLNAEISLGTISNVDEAVEWLSYTYLYVRMKINPQVYGISYQNVMDDPRLDEWRKELIDVAAKALDKAKMVRYNARTGDLAITDLGRTASNYYIKYDTVEIINEMMTSCMSESEILALVSHAQEFQQLKVRDDEMQELDELMGQCEYEVAGGKENLHGKVNILMQSFLNRSKVFSFSLISDLSYIIQNAVRIIRALFEITLRSNNAILATRLLQLALMMEHQQWHWETPLRQFQMLSQVVIEKIEQRDLSVEAMRDMDSKEIGLLVRHQKMGPVIKKLAFELPYIDMSASLHPITRTVLRVNLRITPNFRWNDKYHGKTSESFWVWVEEPYENNIYHSEYFLLTKKQVIKSETQELVMTMPLCDPIPPQYIIKASSDRWLSCSFVLPVNVQSLILPESHPPHTELLDLQPLPVTAFNNPLYESLYNFTHFNPIQTQIFHCLYHTDNNVLLGAPTGSGKTIVAEMAMFRVFSQYPGSKVVYVAPLKALVREKMDDWKARLEGKLSLSVVELTGDTTPDIQAITKSDVIVTTPEKWDGISRSWQTRGYVQKVALIILDEVHLLGEERGPVLEVIVSRTNFISAHTSKPLRIVALSTALANARDLANWLGIKEMGLYNFRPSVRPVPLEVHIQGFPGKHYCPRMATMNKPAFLAITQHSPAQPSLIFVSSRRQTRLTALDLIAYLAAENNPKQWLHTSEEEMDQIICGIKDTNLKLTLAFGIAIHHAGLQERDRKTVEELFLNQKIQVLVATATLAWGVNLPAHLVIVKGTEYYDGKTKRYIDMPITDVLQMMGRAGRPQFDNQGIAVILVHDVKKNFYRKFLYEPFPVESSLLQVLPDHLSAEIVAGTIKTKQEALDYLTWTYFFRRLLQNPAYYELETLDTGNVNNYLTSLIDRTLLTLYEAGCITIAEDERTLGTTSMGRIAAFYYLSHQTMLFLHTALKPTLTLEQCLHVMCHVHEYSLLPVRHNEEILNGELAKKCPWPVEQLHLDSPHVKTNLLLQSHFSRLELPSTDYYTDLKSVLDQAIRILQGMLDVSGECGWLALTIRLETLMQMIIQGSWLTESPFLVLPHVEPWMADKLHSSRGLRSLPEAVHLAVRGYSFLLPKLTPELDEGQVEQVYTALRSLPKLKVTLSLRPNWESDDEPLSQTGSPWPTITDQEYVLGVHLHRMNRPTERRAFAPRYHKVKNEGWLLILGDVEHNELLAMRRVTGPTFRTTAQLTFTTPSRPGDVIYTLFVLSDTYLGLDQQYDVKLRVDSPQDNVPVYKLF